MLVEMLDWEALRGERLRPLRRTEYERMVEDGVFEDEHVELLHGLLVTMSPVSPEHMWVVSRLVEMLIVQLSQAGTLGRYTVRPAGAFAASDYSEPEPDVCVVPRHEFGEPHPHRAHLIIEVSISSLRRDRTIKTGIYAENGVPEYWIVDVEGGGVEVYTEPADGAYKVMTRRTRGETLRPLELPDIAIAVVDILPQR